MSCATASPCRSPPPPTCLCLPKARCGSRSPLSGRSPCRAGRIRAIHPATHHPFHPLSTTAFLNPSEETTMTTKKYETIKVEKEDGITFVIFNRPDKRNAMSPQLHLDMDDALDDLATDDETQVLAITGAGEAFCA